jgi:hypothetical protein
MAVAWYKAITGGQVKAEPGKAVPSDSAADYQAVPTNPAMRPALLYQYTGVPDATNLSISHLLIGQFF